MMRLLPLDRRRTLLCALLPSLALIAGCATTSTSKPNTSSTKITSDRVDKAVSTTGMHRVPLILTGQNSAIVEMTMNGKPIALLLDTGAQSTVIDIRIATEAGVKTSGTPLYSRGIGAGRVAARQGEVITLNMSGFEARVAPTLQDFSGLTSNWLAKSNRPVIGLLGYDIMRAYGAIIDLNEGAMYLRKRS